LTETFWLSILKFLAIGLASLVIAMAILAACFLLEEWRGEQRLKDDDDT
jgi:hypothetical protein